jgi:hypothetical protein
LLQRWDKTERDSDDPPAFEPIPEGHHVKKVSTLLDGQGVPRAQWIQSEKDKERQEADLLTALRASVAEYARPVEPVAVPVYFDDDTLTLYPIGDPHIGMLAYGAETGEDFDLKIAEQDLFGAMDRLVDGSPSSRIGVLAPIGDNFHADDDRQVTPAHGHKLDVDSRASKVARVGLNIMRRLIDRGLERHAEMHVRITPGNHDPLTARWLSLCLECLYENEPRVTVFPNIDPVQIWEFGANMFMLSHGDGFKSEKAGGIMATRAPQMWGRTTYRYSVRGHKHTEETFELPGVLHRTLRTLVPPDAYAHKAGYQSGRDMKAFTFHKDFGEIECKTVGIALARTPRPGAA